MLTKQDRQQLIAGMKQVFPTNEKLDQKLTNLKAEILTEVDNKLDAKLEKQQKEIVKAVGETIDDGIHPQLDKHDKRLDRIERTLNLTPFD